MSRDLTLYAAGRRDGLGQAADAALIAALAIELRDDASAIRQQAAIEALRGLAEGLKAEALTAVQPKEAA
ncbi:hypothetical protein [Methylorubrum extorquens]|uniref:Uncharacterized protein n=1 Tax=Methylorubrum extorquens (strain CM4 / NCIMB 13688) TaxID=440085 RepID=B7KSX4_METC4|nr:hypothetical protein [Methylorubrum extorquens]ACK82476.1 hypothetical protein Mchl_1612 [Methylorubrum extorquens CM4]